ncbi:McrB family protein [Microbacteriaceae bacterium 4G12]
MIKQWDFCLAGILASNLDIEIEFGKSKSVFINSQNIVQFWIKRICEKPESFPNQYFFTCYATDLEKYGFEDDLNQPDFIREENVRVFLEDYLFIFAPLRKPTANNEIYIAKDVELFRKSDSFHMQDTLMPIPVYSEEKHGCTFLELCKKILNKKYIGKVEKFSTDLNDTPRFILWKESESKWYVIGPFTSHSYAHGGFCFSFSEAVKVNDLPEDWLDNMYEVDKSLMFITLRTYEGINTLLEDEDARDLQSMAYVESEKEVAVALPATPPATLPEQSMRTDDHVNLSQIQSEESAFLDYFLQITRGSGLLYAEKDIVNFHTAMKISNLVILQGMSGIGKTKLIHAYGKALHIHHTKQMLVIPVRPSWTDDTDIIGYVDLLHRVYRPSDTGLIDLLIDAAKKENEERIYIVAFDEMNLARVEHYFSQFLSVLEMDGKERQLRLYNENLESKLYNSAEYPPRVAIGDNVIFVGTVNMDESTYHFSDKVLDRANVITLDVLKYSLLGQLKEVQDSIEQQIDYKQYNSFRNTDESLQLSERELDLLWDIHTEMKATDAKTGIGPRIVRQMNCYLKNLPYNSYLSREEALDLQLVQRVLTKVRGSEDVWRAFIGTYHPTQDEVISSQLITIVNKYRDVSSFNKTMEVVKQKAKELKFNGYMY